MKLNAANVDRFGLHSDSRNVARGQKIADVNRGFGRVHFDEDSSGSGNQHFALAAFAESNAWLF